MEIIDIDAVLENNRKLRKAIREMLGRWDGVDNGRCRVCGGHRLYVRRGRGMSPGPCERESCASREWRGLLGRRGRRRTLDAIPSGKYNEAMLDGAKSPSPPIRTGVLPDAPSSSAASTPDAGAPREARKRPLRPALGDPELDRQEEEMTFALTAEERIEICFELSDFMAELSDAPCRRGAVRPPAR